MTRNSIMAVKPPFLKKISVTTTLNDEDEFQFQADYVLPIGEGGQFEADTKETNDLIRLYYFFK
jgi:hypothetical protein